MGKKGNWFSAVKAALNSEPKEGNSQQSEKSKKKWFKKKKQAAFTTISAETVPETTTEPLAPVLLPVAPHSEQPESSGVDTEHPKSAYVISIVEPEKLSEVEKEQAEYAYNVALETAEASEASAAVAEVVTDETKAELAAIKVQTAFRGYMARRRLRAIRGVVRLKSLMQGQAVKKQTASALKCVQTLARMQSQIRERRLRIAEDNLASHFKQKNVKAQAKDLGKLQLRGNGWNSSGKTKDHIETRLQSKHEAAIRRERTLAYSFSHQQTWKASGTVASKMFMDPNNPRWGWSWLERWLDTKPIVSTNEISNCTKQASGNEILKAYAQRHNPEKPSLKPVKKQPRSSNASRLSTSARPKLTSPNPKTGLEQSIRDGKRDKSVTVDRSSVSLAKKRLSRPPSSATSRRSSTSAADVSSISDHT